MKNLAHKNKTYNFTGAYIMKKFFVIQVLLVLFLSMNARAFSAGNPFSDIPFGHWAYNAVTKLASNGINQGYGDGTFRGDRSINRYEVATMIARILAKKANNFGGDVSNFSDVPSGHWASRSVKLSSAAGINKGYSDGSFRGDRNITRYEMAAVVSRLMSKGNDMLTTTETTTEMPFMDVPAGHWAYDFVKDLAGKKFIEGYGDGTFRGDRNITRYEAAVMLSKVMASM